MPQKNYFTCGSICHWLLVRRGYAAQACVCLMCYCWSPDGLVLSDCRYVVQITTLVNAKEKPIRSERTLAALVRVGQAVNLAVERFVSVGEAIACDNPDIQRDMHDACRDARAAGPYAFCA